MSNAVYLSPGDIRRTLALIADTKQAMIDLLAILPTISDEWLAVDTIEQEIHRLEARIRLSFYTGTHKTI